MQWEDYRLLMCMLCLLCRSFILFRICLVFGWSVREGGSIMGMGWFMINVIMAFF
jgi:hypothetical protein